MSEKKLLSVKTVKLLGITLDNKLNFNEHVSNICKKANQKLHALARISNFMCQNKLRVLMKLLLNLNLDIALLFGCSTAEH